MIEANEQIRQDAADNAGDDGVKMGASCLYLTEIEG